MLESDMSPDALSRVQSYAAYTLLFSGLDLIYVWMVR
jgi:hypothetical protein